MTKLPALILVNSSFIIPYLSVILMNICAVQVCAKKPKHSVLHRCWGPSHYHDGRTDRRADKVANGIRKTIVIYWYMPYIWKIHKIIKCVPSLAMISDGQERWIDRYLWRFYRCLQSWFVFQKKKWLLKIGAPPRILIAPGVVQLKRWKSSYSA